MYIDHRIAQANGSEKLVGPWPCEKCGQVSQYAIVKQRMNRIFCRNESCRFMRLIDKTRHRIIEDDGSMWTYDEQGHKTRVTGD